MKLYEILTETTQSASFNSFRATISSLVREIHSIKLNVADKAQEDPRIAKLMASGRKAKWVNTNYYTSKKFSTSGIQTAALSLAKKEKNPKAQAILKQIANIRLSANKDSGRSKVFDTLVNYLNEFGSISQDKELVKLITRMNQEYKQLNSVLKPPKKKEPKKKAPKDTLPGLQTRQAEQTFNQIVSSLPKDLQKKVRQETNRMDPAKKLQYLKQNLS